jgi:PadR family transcriptional regulator, regulatory protein PadR
MRVTHSLVQVIIALMDDPGGRHWGYDLSRRSGVRSGVLYPILHRMLAEGWLTDGWEDVLEVREGRPPRRYYVVTEEGISQLGAILQRARSDSRFAAASAVGTTVAKTTTTESTVNARTIKPVLNDMQCGSAVKE